MERRDTWQGKSWVSNESSDDDWRLQGQDKYLLGTVLHLRPIFAPRISNRTTTIVSSCGVTFTDLPLPETIQAGYTTDDVIVGFAPMF